MAMIVVFMMTMQPASAVTTEVKTYVYEYSSLFTVELVPISDLTITKANKLHPAATLHVNGGKKQWDRYICLYIYNSKGKLIYKEEKCSWFDGTACFSHVDTSKWDYGDYKMKFIYWGSHHGEWPIAKKIVTLHLTQ